MSWDLESRLGAAERAAFDGNRNVVFIAPSCAWALIPLFQRLAPVSATPGTLVLVPELADVAALADLLRHVESANPVLPVTATARAASILGRGAPRTIVATPSDTQRLIRTSQLAAATLERVVIIDAQRMLDLGQDDDLAALLAESGETQRVLVGTDAARLADLHERHARRAPVVTAEPEAPGKVAGRFRHVLVNRADVAYAAALALEGLDPASCLVWDPVEWRESIWDGLRVDPALRVSATIEGARVALAIAAEMPDRDTLAALAAQADQVVVLMRPSDLPVFEAIVERTTVLRVVSEADRARDRMLAVRESIRHQIEAAAQGDLYVELAALEPLLHEHDPALVAAAAIRAARAAEKAPAAPEPEAQGWTRVWVSVGKRDNVRPADLLGALLNTVGLARQAVGRIELRDSFSLVEIRPSDAERAIRGLTGATIRARRTRARLDTKS